MKLRLQSVITEVLLTISDFDAIAHYTDCILIDIPGVMFLVAVFFKIPVFSSCLRRHFFMSLYLTKSRLESFLSLVSSQKGKPIS